MTISAMSSLAFATECKVLPCSMNDRAVSSLFGMASSGNAVSHYGVLATTSTVAWCSTPSGLLSAGARWDLVAHGVQVLSVVNSIGSFIVKLR